MEMVMENYKFSHEKSWKSHGISFPRFCRNPVMAWFTQDLKKLKPVNLMNSMF